jgi:hypothetical protein
MEGKFTMKKIFRLIALVFALVMSIGIVSAADTAANKAYWQQAAAIGIVDVDTNPDEIITHGEFVDML